MSTSVYPVPSSAATADLDSYTGTVTNAFTSLYLVDQALSAGTYNVFTSGSTGYIQLYSSAGTLSDEITVTSTTSKMNISTAVAKLGFFSEYGATTSLPITITRIASPITTTPK